MLKALTPVVFAVAMLATPELGPPQQSDLTSCNRIAADLTPYGVPYTAFTLCPKPA